MDPIDEIDDRKAPALPRIAHFLFAGSLLASVIVMAVVSVTLWQMRQDTWSRAEQSSENLLQGVVGHTERHMSLYIQALNLAAGALSDPEFNDLSPLAKQRMLAAMATSADFIGSVLVLNEAGDIVMDSGSPIARAGNFADRDYFWIHRDYPDLGVYVSQPYRSRLRGGDPSIAVSRRLSNPDGSFAGVILIAVRLAYIDGFFSQIDMGRRGALLLLSADGRILTRQPPLTGVGSVGTDMSKTQTFKRVRSEGAGAFVAKSSLDGVERLFTFSAIPGQPLIVIVGFSVEDILAHWWERTTILGGITLLVCLAMVALAVMLRRELKRRAMAEADLARLSVTDGLTGLANRRRFDAVINREWRRTGRTGASLALLMIDVDHFKILNDRYGHARGDEVLKALGRVIDESIRRPGDLAARYGGEEFAVVLPDTDSTAAMGIAETIRVRCAEVMGKLGDTDMPVLGVSIGVNAVAPSAGAQVEQFILAADTALYRAKSEGRNRIALAA